VTWLLRVWFALCVLDAIGGVFGWLELRKEQSRAACYLARILLASGYRSATTIVGLALFGINVKAEPWYLILGISAVAYKAYATWGWLLFARNVINGGGWKDLFRRRVKKI
jgi:hypothetical protein